MPKAEKLKSDGPTEDFLEFARKPAEERVPIAAAKSDEAAERLRKFDETLIEADLQQEIQAESDIETYLSAPATPHI